MHIIYSILISLVYLALPTRLGKFPEFSLDLLRKLSNQLQNPLLFSDLEVEIPDETMTTVDDLHPSKFHYISSGAPGSTSFTRSSLLYWVFTGWILIFYPCCLFNDL